MSLTNIIDAAEAQHGARVAVQCKGESLTYSDLRPALQYFSSEVPYLAGARVGVILTDSLACFLLYLYLFERGATAVPISVRASAPQLSAILSGSAPHYIVTSEALYNRHSGTLDRYPCLALGAVNSVEPTFTRLEGSDREACRTINSARQYNSADIRTIMFTSGSTGVPKGVCLSEENVLSAARMMAEFLEFTPDRRTIVTPPIYDYYGYIQFFAHALEGAGYIIGESAAYPKSLTGLLETGDVTDLAIVPFALQQLIDFAEKKFPTFFQSLHHLTSSSDILTDSQLERLFAMAPHLTAYNIYGLTEAGRACSRKISAATPASSSIGFPSKGVEITIDGDRDKPGEITIKGPNVAGFLRQVVDDQIEVAPNSEIKTGDLGYFDESGEIMLVGRKDHMLNVMGEKLHPSEIESVALKVDGVDDALARLEADARGNARVVLDVVSSNLEQCRGELKKKLRTGLPRAFLPTHIHAVPEIARTDIGSKAKRALMAS